MTMVCVFFAANGGQGPRHSFICWYVFMFVQHKLLKMSKLQKVICFETNEMTSTYFCVTFSLSTIKVPFTGITF